MEFRKADFKILVFKTNILREEDKQIIAAHINYENRIKKWNVDIGDCDKVLRIESHDLAAEDVIAMIQTAGYACEELPD